MIVFADIISLWGALCVWREVVYRAQEHFALTFFSSNLFQLVAVTTIVDVPCRRSREQNFSIIYPPPDPFSLPTTTHPLKTVSMKWTTENDELVCSHSSEVPMLMAVSAVETVLGDTHNLLRTNARLSILSRTFDRGHPVGARRSRFQIRLIVPAAA